jgi:hypothetical protein
MDLGKVLVTLQANVKIAMIISETLTSENRYGKAAKIANSAARSDVSFSVLMTYWTLYFGAR